MARKDLKKYMLDVLLTIESLQEVGGNFTITDLDAVGNRWILERGVSIIGEAIYQANNIDRSLVITDKSKIIATRHIVIHDYDIVDAPGCFLF